MCALTGLEKRIATVLGYIVVVVPVVFIIFWLGWLNHVGVNEVGVAYDSIRGTVTTQTIPGWYITAPWVKVSYVSTLPFKVEIPSNARVIVAKIVRFKVEGLDDYVRLQGFSYSMNSSMKNAFLGYAFSELEYPFMEIMQDVTTENIEGLRPLKMGEPTKK